MSNIEKHALIEKIKKQTESYDTVVLREDEANALLDELEAKDKAWSAQGDHINQQADRIESLEKKNGELGRALGTAEKRIAELEKREVKLPDINNYLSDVTELTLDRALRLTAEGVRSGDMAAIRAAGIHIKGED
ncbi:hypothetical protein [Enterobacter soli]|uniref:hypothetical protein n=1 Tax=Enterobacter soli TaxID=885040 RepID=UPI0034CF4C5E